MLTLSHQDYHRQSVYWPKSSSTLLVRLIFNFNYYYYLKPIYVESDYSSDPFIFGAIMLGHWVVTPSSSGGYLQAHRMAVSALSPPSDR